MMNEPNNRIHCLSSCVKYVLSTKNIHVDEIEMMLSPETTKIIQSDSGIDTRLNDVIWRWIHTKFTVHVFKHELPMAIGDLLCLPVKFLNYSRVYQIPFIADKDHFVVIIEKIAGSVKVYDPFIPTVPLTEKYAWIQVPSNSALNWIELNLSGYTNKKSNSKKIVSFIRDDISFQFLIQKVKNLSENMTLDLVGQLGESSLEGSRKALLAYECYVGTHVNNAESTALRSWQNTWLQLRTNLYRYHLTRSWRDKEAAIGNCKTLSLCDATLFDEFEKGKHL